MTKAMKCAKKLAKYLGQAHYEDDVLIYVDGNRYKITDKGELLFDIVADPKAYIEGAGNILSMSFEGVLYDCYNYSWNGAAGEGYIVDKLEKLFNKYGFYSEMCYSWALTLGTL